MQKPKLGKIKPLSAKGWVAVVLRKAILSRDLVEGQEITLEGIVKMVDISNILVREVFQILAADGLVQMRPNKGTAALGTNEQTTREHYEIRTILESETVAKTSRPRTDILRIAQVHHVAEKALADNNSAGYSDLNQTFHTGIWNMAGNGKMKMLFCNMWNGLSMRYKMTEEEYAVTSLREHKVILQAPGQHSEALARQRMYEHIIRPIENMLTCYLPDPASRPDRSPANSWCLLYLSTLLIPQRDDLCRILVQISLHDHSTKTH